MCFGTWCILRKAEKTKEASKSPDGFGRLPQHLRNPEREFLAVFLKSAKGAARCTVNNFVGVPLGHELHDFGLSRTERRALRFQWLPQYGVACASQFNFEEDAFHAVYRLGVGVTYAIQKLNERLLGLAGLLCAIRC